MAVMAAVVAVGELMAAARKDGRKHDLKHDLKVALKVVLRIATKAAMRVVGASAANAVLKAAPKVLGRTGRIARPVKAGWKRSPVMTFAARHKRAASNSHATTHNRAMRHSHVAKAVNRALKAAGANAPVVNARNAPTAYRAMP